MVKRQGKYFYSISVITMKIYRLLFQWRCSRIENNNLLQPANLSQILRLPLPSLAAPTAYQTRIVFQHIVGNLRL